MRAELAHLTLSEPEDPVHFGLQITAYVGAEGGHGADRFDFHVCTPSWLATNTSLPAGYVFLRHHLLVERWDENLVADAIRTLCVRTEAAGWEEVAAKLSHYGQWEFEEPDE